NGYGISCNGASDGGIDVSVSGGAGSYTYLWNTGTTTQDLGNIMAGNYSLTVSDANGCSSTYFVTITQPSTLVSSVSSVNVSCNGLANGSINLTVSGGTGIYTYTWSDGSTTQDLTGISGGNYLVTVSDANGCTTSQSVVISEPLALAVSLSDVGVASYNGYSVSCNGSLNGGIQSTVIGGTAPYTYVWSNGSTLANPTNLGAGVYSVTVSDSHSCTTTATITLTQPPVLNATGITTSHNGYGVSCQGSTDGSINVSVTGGAGVYTYSWSNGATTQDLNNLGAGIYSLTVVDGNGCTDTYFTTITEPAAIELSTVLSHVLCNGSMNGAVNLSVTGGTGIYTYSWSNGATTQDLSGLAGGTYTVTVIDNNGCFNVLTSVITEPQALVVTGVATSFYGTYNVSCNGASDASLEISVDGGVLPYVYAWSNGATSQNLSGIPAGSYTVTVTDANSCVQTVTVNITQPTALNLNLAHTDISCNGTWNGAINATISGGVTPYIYAWSNTAVSQDLTNLGPGTYTLTVVDANGCSIVSSAVITEPLALEITSADITHATCNNLNDGAIDLTVTGGTSPIVYAWSNSATTQDLGNLSPGTYTVTITDANNCQLVEEYEVLPGSGAPVANFVYVDAGGNVSFINFSINVGPNDQSTWDFGDGSPTVTVSGTASVVHDYTASGDYFVTLTVVTPCGTSTKTVLVVVRMISLEDIDNEHVVVLYPNPSDGIFNLGLNTTENIGEVLLQVFDATGRLIQNDHFEVSGIEVVRTYDLSSYSSGTYLVRMITSLGVINRPVIISNK
ncbi:MAG: T9SS type A sorting domain-containing protein, partial [Bacteroidales bacterium]|nr:T9SS type A sorting domain-containing protein [Bacteroidales bacterium]